MTESPTVVLQQRRSKREIISETFEYFRTHARTISLGFAVFVLPFVLIDATITAFEELNAPVVNELTFQSFVNSVYGSNPFSRILEVISTTLLTIVAIGHVQLVREGRNDIELSDFTAMIQMYFWRIIGLSILVNILTYVGMIALIVGGIFVAVKLSLSYVPAIMEDETASESLKASWNITKEKWWDTCLLLLGLFIPFFIISMICPLPFSVVSSILYDMGIFSENVYVITDAILWQIPYLAMTFSYLFIHIAAVFMFFNLKEWKEGTGFGNKVEQLRMEAHRL